MPFIAPTAGYTATYASKVSLTISEDAIEHVMIWTIVGISSTSLVCIVLGFIDAKKIGENDLFQWQGIVLFMFYTNDFVSDIFVALKLVSEATSDEFNNDANGVFWGLFAVCIVFLLIPVVMNVIQFQNEINQWDRDKNRIFNSKACAWVESKVKMIYLKLTVKKF